MGTSFLRFGSDKDMGVIVFLATLAAVTALKGSLYSPMYQQLQGPSLFNSMQELGMDYSVNERPNYQMLMESPCNCYPPATGRWRCCNFCCTQACGCHNPSCCGK